MPLLNADRRFPNRKDSLTALGMKDRMQPAVAVSQSAPAGTRPQDRSFQPWKAHRSENRACKSTAKDTMVVASRCPSDKASVGPHETNTSR